MALLISSSSACSEHQYCWSSHEKPARNMPGMCWLCHMCSNPLPGTQKIALTWSAANQSSQFGPTGSCQGIYRNRAPRWLNNAERLLLDVRVCSGVLGGLRAVNMKRALENKFQMSSSPDAPSWKRGWELLEGSSPRKQLIFRGKDSASPADYSGKALLLISISWRNTEYSKHDFGLSLQRVNDFYPAMYFTQHCPLLIN